MGFFSVLQLILITLKLIGTVTFSWWYIFIPAYIGVIFNLFGFVAFVYMSEKMKGSR